MKKLNKGLAISLAITGALLQMAGGGAVAQTPSVSQPAGINLGATSFYDGFSGDAGLTWLTETKYSSATSMKDNSGRDVPAFKNPKINGFTWTNQINYALATSIGGWRPQFTAILPTVSLNSTFGTGGASLKDSGTGLGDITIGAALQSAPIMNALGNPLFVQRFELDMILPTGKYDKSSDINPGAGFGSIIPYWAATLLPTASWEVSWRLHYMYNMRNNSPASSTPVTFQGEQVRNTQAGKAAWINFTTSYSITPDVSIGINGYYFKQLTDSKANNFEILNARERVFGIGPGLMWRIDRKKALWINTYSESHVRNRAATPFSAQVLFAINF